MPSPLKILAHSRFAPLALPIAAITIVACAMTASAFAQTATTVLTPSSTLSDTPVSPATMTANADGTMEYDNSQFGFSLTYPADLAVSEESDDSSATQSIYFMSSTTNKQFQIIATPYSQVDISAGAFNPHVAYGTNDQGVNLQDVNYMPGDTPECNFVKNGVQYEVVGMHSQEAWLINILKTWQFN